MAKVLLVAKVKDLARWEKGLRSHREQYKSSGIKNPIAFGTNEDNEVAVLVEAKDPKALASTLRTPENMRLMISDGVKILTVKVFVVDRELSF